MGEVSDVRVGEEAVFGSNNIITSRQMRDSRTGIDFIVKDTEKRVLHEMVKEAARFGIEEADVLHSTEIVWRCEARATLKVKRLPHG
jgi:hypothetical protein